MRVVPCVANVLEVSARSGHGRDLADAFGRGEGQQGRRCDRRRRAIATTSRTRPAGRHFPRLASARAGRRRTAVLRSKAARCEPAGKSSGPGDRERTAAEILRGLRQDSSVARRQTASTGRKRVRIRRRIGLDGRYSAVGRTEVDSDDVRQGGLLDFDFGRRENFRVLTCLHLRQVHLLHAPALVAKDALRRFPVCGHIADELHGIRIVLPICVRVPSTPSITGLSVT